jgi:hydrogenase maturation protein HypF
MPPLMPPLIPPGPGPGPGDSAAPGPAEPGRECIRVGGLVQGVGFRPTVWRLARDCGLTGDVRNDAAGVRVRVAGSAAAIDRFCQRLLAECPPLARIDTLERHPLTEPLTEPLAADDFRITGSGSGEVHTGVVADAATCPACLAETLDPAARRHRYPFTNCTHCGPRLSILRAIPYDRANTSMARFRLCPDCHREYRDPADRRFHAQPIACPACGPRVWLVDARGEVVSHPGEDALRAASRLLAQGRILAIKGLGGFHLACDAANPGTVAELRRRKHRFHKPFALMARDPEVIRHYAHLGDAEAAALTTPAAPILLLDALADASLPRHHRPRHQMTQIAPEVAPGQVTLGFMLPYTPLHHLLLADWDRPLVMTSGNRSEEPQCTGNREAALRLRSLADYQLVHDRTIVNRLDDSVLRLMDGVPRLLRRARGFAPAPLPLPPGFAGAPPLLALGGELKSTFCLVRDGQAILSQHLGDLEDAGTAAEYERTLALYRDLFRHQPHALAVDRHPDYRSTRLGRVLARQDGLPLIPVQHHHAHIAALLAEQGRPLAAGPVLGLALDGLGLGDDGSLWGGEFLVADYLGYRRLAHLRPTPLPGATRALREPWRNTYAQLVTHLGWERLVRDHPDLELTAWLRRKPLELLAPMLARGLNSPPSSSCGRLFDAVAGALDLCRETVSYEGQAAVELEALAATVPDPDTGYPLPLEPGAGDAELNPAPLWQALLADLDRGTGRALIAARFQAGLADACAATARQLARERGLTCVALSGGVFQNRALCERLSRQLRDAGLEVLSHQRVPANDGGLALGQAAVAAALSLAGRSTPRPPPDPGLAQA